MKNRRVLIAGGAGLLGISLTRRMIDDGYDVISSYFNREPPNSMFNYYKKYDFTLIDDCIRATKNCDILVISAVVSSGLAAALDSPTSKLLPNLQIHAGLLEACVINKVRKIVWISSSMTYQEAYYPIREDEMDLNEDPHPHYMGIGWAFRYIEKLAEYYSQVHDIDTTVLRTTNIYGPYDRFDPYKAHVLPAILRRAIDGENPFVVWGTGHHVRDFIYVDDLVEAIVRSYDVKTGAGPINFGSDNPTSIRELVECILDETGHDVEPCYDITKPTAIPYRSIDNKRAEVILGKIPRTSLKDGVRKVVDWFNSEEFRE